MQPPPPPPPPQQPPRRSWWSRNWKWALPVGCLLPVLLCGGGGALFFFVFGLSIDVDAVDSVGWLIAFAVVVSVIGKLGGTYAAGRVGGFTKRQSLNAGTALIARGEFTIILAQVAATTDGRILTGLLTEWTPETITLLDAKNKRTVVNRSDVEHLKESPISLMPENLLDPLTEQQIRDLFAYLQSENTKP